VLGAIGSLHGNTSILSDTSPRTGRQPLVESGYHRYPQCAGGRPRRDGREGAKFEQPPTKYSSLVILPRKWIDVFNVGKCP